MHLVSGQIQYLVKIISSDTRCNTNTGVTKVTIVQQNWENQVVDMWRQKTHSILKCLKIKMLKDI